jgi:hypothetical protein
LATALASREFCEIERAVHGFFAYIRAQMESAARAASKEVEVSDQYGSSGARPTRERLSVRVRSAFLTELADASGRLRAFELSHGHTTLGAVCNSLAAMPGVRFENRGATLWSAPATRFTFNGCLYEVTIPAADVRVAPVEQGIGHAQTEALLVFIKRNLLARIRVRARPRFG